MPEDKQNTFIMYRKSPARLLLVAALKRLIMGRANADGIANTKAIDYAIRFTLANQDIVKRYNPHWQDKWTDPS